MNILVIGAGGREHALVHKLNESTLINRIFAIPGNPGMTDIAEVHNNIEEKDHEQIIQFSHQHNVDWVIIGPEQPLIDGLADKLREEGFKVFGPNQAAAQIEGSKLFAKRLMSQYNIPTADYQEVYNKQDAQQYIKQCAYPVVIKKDGLAAGKGVIIAKNQDEAEQALELFYGSEQEGLIVFEQFLEGEEFSLMTFVNGEYVVSFDCIAQDHKRAYDNDEGPNTGGMGAYCPVPHISQDIVKQAHDRIAQPITKALYKEGFDYFGVLYIGAILTEEGPKVIEFNARFGDPEAQVLLTHLKSDLMQHIIDLEQKQPIEYQWKDSTVVGVMLASKGYPNHYDKGFKVSGFDLSSGQYFVSGLTRKEDDYITNGGRVILAIGKGESLLDAQNNAYENVKKIQCDNLFYRKDIANKALNNKN